MPVLPTSPSDVTAVVRIAAQAMPATPGAPPARASSSGSRSIGGSAIGAIVRASRASMASSPSTAITYRVRPVPVITVYPDGTPVKFEYTGVARTYVVPEGVTRLFVEMWGAGGGNGVMGGRGAYLDGYLPVIPGEILRVIVGRGGTETSTTMDIDQGNQFWRSGGFSGIFRGSTHLVIVGAGGGSDEATNPAGSGGLDRGETAWTALRMRAINSYGTQTGGGTNTSSWPASPGALYRGDGTHGQSGGAGYYGGTTVAWFRNGHFNIWGGGGGSSYYSLLEHPWGARGVNMVGYGLTPNTKSPRYMTGVANSAGNGLVWVTPIYSPTIAPRVISGLFEYTGTIQTYKVPVGVTKLHAFLWGAAGGGKAFRGGTGGYVEGVLTVTPNQVLSVIVGKGGALTAEPTTLAMGNGGSGNASGGGFSAIIDKDDLYLVLAGGGGGGGTLGIGGSQYEDGRGSGYGGAGGGGGNYRNIQGGVAGGVDGGIGTAFTGGAGGLGTGAGGGGGWVGGGGSSSAGTGGGGGGSACIVQDTLIRTIDMEDENNSGTAIPSGARSLYYKSGIGTSGVNKAGGNGMVVIFPMG